MICAIELNVNSNRCRSGHYEYLYTEKLVVICSIAYSTGLARDDWNALVGLKLVLQEWFARNLDLDS